jgi:hypothetical protein
MSYESIHRQVTIKLVRSQEYLLNEYAIYIDIKALLFTIITEIIEI